jgi:Helix-turn-helix domain
LGPGDALKKRVAGLFFGLKGAGRMARQTVLLSEEQVAERWMVSVKTLQGWRVRGGGPKFIKLGRVVRYSELDLEEFLAVHTIPHTAALNSQTQAEVTMQNGRE